MMKGLVYLALGIALIVGLPLLYFLAGAFSGWLIGAVFTETFTAFFNDYLKLPLRPWQVGGLFGFAAGFFARHGQTK